MKESQNKPSTTANKQPATRSIEKEIEIEATPEAVWRAWATPRGISSFFTDSAEGEAVEGKTVHWTFEGFASRIPYRVVQAEPNRRLTLEFEAPDRPPGVIDIQVEYHSGRTHLRLVNSGFLAGEEWDDEFAGIDSGWQMVLATLKYWLENHPECNSKQTIFLRRPAEFKLGENLPFFVQAEKLGKWLGRVDRDLSSGMAFQLEVSGEDLLLAGRVETITPTEVLLSLSDPSVLIGLKAFSTGPQNLLGVHGMTWLPEGNAFLKRTSTTFQEALKRLATRLGRSDPPGKSKDF